MRKEELGLQDVVPKTTGRPAFGGLFRWGGAAVGGTIPRESPNAKPDPIGLYMKTATFCMGYFPERDLDSVLNKKIEQFPEFRKEFFYSTFFRPPVLRGN